VTCTIRTASKPTGPDSRYYLKHAFRRPGGRARRVRSEHQGFLVTFKIRMVSKSTVSDRSISNRSFRRSMPIAAQFLRVTRIALQRRTLEKPVRKCRSRHRRRLRVAIVRPVATGTSRKYGFDRISVAEGPRTYIERINVRGNTRHRDTWSGASRYCGRRWYTGRWVVVPSAGEELISSRA